MMTLSMGLARQAPALASPLGPLLLCSAMRQKNSGRDGRENMGGHETEKRCLLYGEDDPGREGRVRRAAERA